MAINGVKPGTGSVQDVVNMPVPEMQTDEVTVEKVSTQMADAQSSPQNTTLDDSQVTEEQLDKKLKDALSMANNKIKQSQPQTRCEFTYHEDMNRVSIKLIDKETDKVVKEIPPEKTIKMIEKLWEIAGLLVDEKL
ncbi:flagellar protein FlaG [Anaerosporobacter faecicola]|uniref:flagellar protein FlaG n=1 Tax=Anaerosporobacter faecicola TaxID=2718714 RepID=UPI00143BF302|nr:flagellar protein FlaG [Anaerosporobacter faecicola]